MDDATAPTIYDLQGPGAAGVRSLPGLVLQAVRLTRRAAPRETLFTAALVAIGAVAGLVELLAARSGVTALSSAAGGAGGAGGASGAAVFAAALPWVLLLAVAQGVRSGASAWQQPREQIMGELVRRTVENDMLDLTAAVDLVAFETPEFHNRLSRVSMAGHQAVNLARAPFALAAQGITVVVGLGTVAVLQPILALALLLVVPLTAWAASRSGADLFETFYRLTPLDRERGYLVQVLTDRDAAKEVLAFGAGPRLRARRDRLDARRLEELRSSVRRAVRRGAVAHLAVLVLVTSLLLFQLWLATTGRASLADVTTSLLGLVMASGALGQLGWTTGQLAEAASYVADHAALRAAIPRIAARRPTGTPPAGLDCLDARDVTFRYPSAEHDAVRGVSFTLRRGETVALVGENGSGKTTLAKLVAGLYAPAAGTIRWDGADVAGCAPEEYRRQIAVVFQDFGRYHLSARENVAFGRPDAPDDDATLARAARAADAADLVRRLPEGWDTQLGPVFTGGTDLSGGQWQRLALARAFHRDAPLLVLDEPTSALDPRAEAALFERVRELMAGRTVLLISHRFSTVRSADRILVLDGGRLVEQGDHDTLMAAGGLYAELFTLQASAYSPSPSPSTNPPSPFPSRDHAEPP